MTELELTSSSAPIWRRVAALVYDLFILLAISMAYGAVVLIAYSVINGAPEKDYSQFANGPLFQLGWYLSLAGFYYFFWRKDGQTIGMRAWRLKLLGNDNQRASVKNCIVRILISPVLVVSLLIGYFWKLIDRDKLCLHDRLSKTKVVVIAKSK